MVKLNSESEKSVKFFVSTYTFVTDVFIENLGKTYILANTLLGRFDFINKKTADLVQNFKQKGEIYHYNSEVKELINKGYLIDDIEKEESQAKILFKQSLDFTRKVYGLTCAIIPTYSCNLNCKYCWQQHDIKRNLITEDQIIAVFDFIDSLENSQENATIFLFGGEPFQQNDIQKKRILMIAEQARKRGCEFNAVTNGLELSHYASLLNGMLNLVQVTLDGPEEIHNARRGGFKRIVNGIDDALKNNIDVNIRINLDANNVQYIPDLIEFVRNKWDTKIQTISVAPVKSYQTGGFTQSDLETLTKLLTYLAVSGNSSLVRLEGYRPFKYLSSLIGHESSLPGQFFMCEAQLNFWACDNYGKIFTCFESCGVDSLSVGRYFPNIEYQHGILNQLRSYSCFDNEKCRVCPASPQCCGGCVIARLATTKNNMSYCEHNDTLFKLALRYYAPSLFKLIDDEKSNVGIFSNFY